MQISSRLAVIGLLVGCGNAGSGKGQNVVSFEGNSSLEDLTVVWNGQRAPLRTAKPTAYFDVASLPKEAPTGVTVEVETPCGITSFPATVTALESSVPSIMKNKLSVAADVGAQQRVWIDAPEGTQVTIGTSVVKAPMGFVRNTACAPNHAVKIGSAAVGTLEKTGGSIFITSIADACYQVSELGYGEGASTTRRVLRGSQVHAGVGNVTDFLRPADTSVRVKESTQTAYRTELVKIACPPAATP